MNDESPPTDTEDEDLLPPEVAAGLDAWRRRVSSALDYAREIHALDLTPHTVQHRIDGLMYTSTKIPAQRGLDLLPRVGAILGPALSRALAVGVSVELTPALITVLSDRAANGGLIPIVRDLLFAVKCDRLAGEIGRAGDVLPVMDEHFAGEYLHLLKVCIFSLAHNFRGFSLGGR
jgi:hypothetical protein